MFHLEIIQNTIVLLYSLCMFEGLRVIALSSAPIKTFNLLEINLWPILKWQMGFAGFEIHF